MTTSKNDSSLTTQTKIALLEQSIGHINDTLLRIEKRFDNIDSYLNKRFDTVDQRFINVDKKFENLEHSINKRFDNVDKKFEKVEKEISTVRELGWSQFKWIMGTILISILIPIAKGFFTP